MPTGVDGLDEITGGGLPRGRATLLLGGAGSGKTLLALQTLVYGASERGEPGIFVAFEESAERITANAAAFGWDLPVLQRKKLFFLDAQPGVDLPPVGSFDLQGLLAALDAKVNALKPKRIVFDSIDILLDLLADPVVARREVNRLHEWLLARRLSALITAKVGVPSADKYGFIQFMVDCVVRLNHETVSGVSQRSLRVMKYRGSSFAENDSPLIFGPEGLEVAGLEDQKPLVNVSTERVSSGVARLDTMLGGGYYRGASVLVTGSPGTAKTTLGGAFADAAGRRGEKVLFVTFDSDPAEVVRNLKSVGLDLARHVRRGRLFFKSARTGQANAEAHLLRVKALASRHGVRCLVIDPVSALAQQGDELTSHSVVERLIDWAKARGITIVCTSLLAHAEPQAESTSLQISTIADTWMHLSYHVSAGERNRALTIVKSRGTAHSNQVRELVLSHRGLTLQDVYSADGQVLMGTLRWEKERAELAEQARIQAEANRKRVELNVARNELDSRVRSLRAEMKLKETELQALLKGEALRRQTHAKGKDALKSLRRGDDQPVG